MLVGGRPHEQVSGHLEMNDNRMPIIQIHHDVFAETTHADNPSALYPGIERRHIWADCLRPFARHPFDDQADHLGGELRYYGLYLWELWHKDGPLYRKVIPLRI